MEITPQTDTTCVMCDQAISNPICTSCLENEMEQWIGEQMPEAKSSVKRTTKLFESFEHNSIRCVICGSFMNSCAHCYSAEVRDVIPQELRDEFEYIFNFELKDG